MTTHRTMTPGGPRSRLTQDALARHPIDLDDDPGSGTSPSVTSPKTTDRTAAPPYRVTIQMVTRSLT